MSCSWTFKCRKWTVLRPHGESPGDFDAVSRPRLIALTANVFKSDQDACLEAGMDDFLGKPMDLDQLRKVLLLCSRVSRPEHLAHQSGSMLR